MAWTLVSQNRCSGCRTAWRAWYPRGKRLSLDCPDCGRFDRAVVVNGVPWVAVVGALLYVLSGRFDDAKAPNAEFIGFIESPTRTEVRTPEAALPVDVPSLVSIAASRPPKAVRAKPPRTVKPRQPAPPGSAPVPSKEPVSSVALPPSPAPAPPGPVGQFERIYSDKDISELENQKRYLGDDSIVRSRLGIPSRETGKLIPPDP